MSSDNGEVIEANGNRFLDHSCPHRRATIMKGWISKNTFGHKNPKKVSEEATSEELNASWVRQVVFIGEGDSIPVCENILAEAHFSFG